MSHLSKSLEEPGGRWSMLERPANKGQNPLLTERNSHKVLTPPFLHLSRMGVSGLFRPIKSGCLTMPKGSPDTPFWTPREGCQKANPDTPILRF